MGVVATNSHYLLVSKDSPDASPTVRNSEWLFYLRNFSFHSLLPSLAMRTIAGQKLRVILLAIYIPLSVSIGMLHSDDLCSGGNGRPTVETQSAQALTRSSENGVCFACLFIAGHLIQHEPHLPVFSSTIAFVANTVQTAAEASPRLNSARAPPVLSLQ